jgi:hypothetical protein
VVVEIAPFLPGFANRPEAVRPVAATTAVAEALQPPPAAGAKPEGTARGACLPGRRRAGSAGTRGGWPANGFANGGRSGAERAFARERARDTAVAACVRRGRCATLAQMARRKHRARPGPSTGAVFNVG